LDLSNIRKVELFSLHFQLEGENSLEEINLESTGGDKWLQHFLGGQKLTNTCSFVGGCIIVQQEKISKAERIRTKPSPMVRILCALRLESRKKLSTWS